MRKEKQVKLKKEEEEENNKKARIKRKKRLKQNETKGTRCCWNVATIKIKTIIIRMTQTKLQCSFLACACVNNSS